MLGSLIQLRENRQQSIWVVIKGPENSLDRFAVSSSNNRESKKLQVRVGPTCMQIWLYSRKSYSVIREA